MYSCLCLLAYNSVTKHHAAKSQHMMMQSFSPTDFMPIALKHLAYSVL